MLACATVAVMAIGSVWAKSVPLRRVNAVECAKSLRWGWSAALVHGRRESLLVGSERPQRVPFGGNGCACASTDEQRRFVAELAQLRWVPVLARGDEPDAVQRPLGEAACESGPPVGVGRDALHLPCVASRLLESCGGLLAEAVQAYGGQAVVASGGDDCEVFGRAERFCRGLVLAPVAEQHGGVGIGVLSVRECVAGHA